MPPDNSVILEAGATIDVAPYEQGLTKMVEATEAATGAVKTSFENVAAADAAVSKSVNNMASQTAASFANVRSGGIFAFDAVRAKVIEATAEVGRLRTEILETDDAAKLAQLQSQLGRARAEMMAARTELKALGFESTETREKLNLMGESIGVRLPSALSRLLGQLPAVQSAMAAAFQASIVIFFISMIGEAIEKLGELTESAGGFSKSVKEAYEQSLDYNQRMIVKNIELAEKMDKIGSIGKEGVAKYRTEVETSEEATRRWAERLGETNKDLNETRETIEKLESKKDWVYGPFAGLLGINRQLEEAEAREKRLIAARDEAEGKVREKPVESKTHEAEERKREFEETLSIAKAATEEQKRTSTSYVDFYVAGLKRMFASDQINLEEEVAGERAAVQAKLEIDRAYAAARQEELTRKATTGANVEPERAAVRSSLAAAELAARTQLAEIDERFDRQTIDHANSVSVALAQATKRTVDEETSATEAAARRQVETRQLSIEQETSILKDELNKRLNAEQDLLQEELRAANARPYQNAARIIELNAQIKELTERRINETNEIEETGLRQVQERQRRESEEQIRFTRETSNLQLETTRRLDDSRLKTHQISLGQWEASERGALDRWYDAQREAFTKAAEEAARLFGVQSLEYRRVINDMTVMDQKYLADRERIDERVAAQFQQSMNVISRSFDSAFDRMFTEHTKFGQVASNLWSQMVQGWARMGTQIVASYVQSLAQLVIQEALTALRIQVIHTQTVSAKTATETLFDSFLNLLGIKRAAKDTVQATTELAAKKVTLAADVTATTTAETAKTAAVTVGATARTAAETGGLAIITAAEIAARTAEGSATAAKDVGEVISLAAVGAAGAAAAAAPGGPALMTAAAAAAEAIILSFLPQAAVFAEKGGVMDEDGPVFAHAKETILPAPISLGLQNLIAAGGLNSPVDSSVKNFSSQNNSESNTSTSTSTGPSLKTGDLTLAAPSPVDASVKNFSTAGNVNTSAIGDLTSNLQNLIGGGGLAPQIPAALSAPPAGSSSTSNVTHINNAKHISVRPNVTVNQTGESSKMSVEDISTAVRRGIRQGLINV
jgi:hypothetical protein